VSEERAPRETELDRALPSLLVLSKRGVQRVPLARGRNVAGRGDDAAIRLEDERASRHHVEIHVDADVTVVDLGSKNGTFLAEHRLVPHEPVTLGFGTPLTIGSTVVMLDDETHEPWSAPLLSAEAFAERVAAEAQAAGQRGTFGVVLVRFRASGEGAAGSPDTTLGSTVDAHTLAARRLDRSLRELVRPTDVLSYGGPAEYRLLLPSADEEATRRMAIRLARGLEANEAPADVGFAVFPRQGRSVDELVLAARSHPVPARGADPTAGAHDGSAFERLAPLVDRIAVGNIHVLLLGETGVGKEVLARIVHARSRRASARMVTLNCAALSESLLESELFGYERGAFTGATSAKPGLLEHASGGTLFLDEVGEMPAAIQARILRVLEHSEVTRLGSVHSRTVDVRFIAATNRDLEAEVAAGRFRRDLYFRLNGVAITIPPLRERAGEIATLAAELARKVSEGIGRARPPTLRADTLSILHAHDWPGNVRELRNVIERAVLLVGDGDVIKPSHLALDQLVRPTTPRNAERDRVVAALDRFAGNQTRAADALGISRRTLVSRLRDLDIPRPRKRGV
jgi:two-component system response regulator AtoC